VEAPWAALVVPGELDGPTLELMAEFLTRLNEKWLREHPETPALYESGAFYVLQPEYWLTIPWAITIGIRLGHGLDCKVLSAWRAAELRVRGNEPTAACIWSAHLSGPKLVYHVRVRRGDGRIEDPSAYLGMHAALPAGGASTWNP
jgi:hypothetical protein